MVIIGIDAHKRSHTIVVVDEQGRQLAETTTGTSSSDHLQLLGWAARHGADRVWAVEDCRHLSRRLERRRLSRTGNRQLNAAIHRIALTRAHWHPDAKAMIARRRANGDGGLEVLRILKRRLSDVVYRALKADAAAELLLAA